MGLVNGCLLPPLGMYKITQNAEVPGTVTITLHTQLHACKSVLGHVLKRIMRSSQACTEIMKTRIRPAPPIPLSATRAKGLPAAALAGPPQESWLAKLYDNSCFFSTSTSIGVGSNFIFGGAERNIHCDQGDLRCMYEYR